MEILGVGPMELLLILIIALIILGPNDMVKSGRTLGRWMRRVVKSPLWAALLQTSRNLRTLPNRLMREAGLEEELAELRATQEDLRRQVEEVQKIRGAIGGSLSAVSGEVNPAGGAIRDEARTIGGGLDAWTRPPDAPTPPSVSPPAGEGLDAWATPASPSTPPADNPTPPPVSPSEP